MKKTLVIIAAYTVLTLLLTYPVILNINSEIAGLGSDSHQTVADVIHFSEELKALGFWGSIQEIITHVRIDTVSIVSYLNTVVDVTLAYNLYWLFSFIAASYGAFALTRFLIRETFATTKEKVTERLITYASFMAGLIYGFAPIHFIWGMGFRGSTHIEWIPLTTLFILKAIRFQKLRYVFGAAIFFIFLAVNEIHFIAFYLLFLPPLLWWYLRKYPSFWRNLAFIRNCAIGIGVIAVIFIIISASFLKIASSENNYLNPGIKSAIAYSNDALSLLTPPFTHTLIGPLFADVRNSFTGNEFEHSAYVGIVVLSLAILVLIYRKSRDSIFWAVGAFSFYILSIGPFLHFGGVVEPKIPLPYLLLHHFLPYFNNIRSVDRIAVISMMCFAVAAAYGFVYLVQRFRLALHGQHILVILLSGFIIFEFFALPYPTTSLDYPHFYNSLRQEPGDFAILEIPSSTNYRSAAKSQYYRSIHGKKMINFFQPARFNPENPLYVRNISIPILKSLLYSFPRGSDIVTSLPISLANADANTGVLQYYDVRYIILHKNYLGSADDEIELDDFIRIRNFLRNYVHTEEIYQDSDLIAYKLSEQDYSAPILVQSGEWNGTEIDDERQYQLTGQQSELIINNINQQNSLNLRFIAKAALGSIRNLQILQDEQILAQFLVDDQPRQYQVNVPLSSMEANTLQFLGQRIEQLDLSQEPDPPVFISEIEALPISNNQDDISSLLSEYAGQNTTLQVPLFGSEYSAYNIVNPQEIFAGNSIFEPKVILRWPLLIESRNAANTFGSLRSYHDIIEENYYQSSLRYLADRENIQQVLVHKNLLEPEEALAWNKYLISTVGSMVVSTTDEWDYYQLPPSSDEDTPLIIRLSKNWDILENKGQASQKRKTKNYASLSLDSPQSEQLSGELNFSTYTCPDAYRRAVILLNGETISSLTINWSSFQSVSLPITIPSGSNELQMVLFDENSQLLEGSDLQECPLWIQDVFFKPIK
ncbi:MAG: hypothetical protein V1853_02625 [bacterium]